MECLPIFFTRLILRVKYFTHTLFRKNMVLPASTAKTLKETILFPNIQILP